MTSGHKTLLSLLISVLIFAGIAVLAFTTGFKFIEVKFYAPVVVKSINEQLNKISASFDEYYDELNDRFATFVKDENTLSFMERDVSDEVIIAREKKVGQLYEQTPGLEGIRLIETDGIRLHYSSYESDIFSQTKDKISYKHYSDLNETDYTLIQALRTEEKVETVDAEKALCSLYFDGKKNEILFRYPLYDEMDALRGTFVFYIDASDFTRYVTARDVVSFNSKITVVPPSGIVFGLPVIGRAYLTGQIQNKWDHKLYALEPLAQTENDTMNLYIISHNKNQHAVFAWVCNEDYFTFSESERMLLLLCLFIVLFLTITLLFNIKHDDMVVIKSKIKKFQYSLLKEYIDRKDSSDWKTLSKEISQRKYDVYDEVKSNLGKRGKKHSEEVDKLLDSSWNEIMAALAGGVVSYETSDEQKSQVASDKKSNVEIINESEPVEVLEEIEDAEPVEELEEIEDAESVEELEEIEEAEPVEELEEIEEAEPVEELEEIEEAEPVEELEEIEDAEPVDELEEIEETEPVEELEEIEDAEPVEELEEVEDAEPVEELEEIEDAEPVDELEEVESIEDNGKRETESPPVTRTGSLGLMSRISAMKYSEPEPEEKDEFVEQTIEEYEWDDRPQEEEKTSEESEKIKKEAEASFHIAGLDFSDLDEDSKKND